jgi:rSAM/selenodomain-associated transferase 2
MLPEPRYSIIIPVLNETAAINDLLAQLRNLDRQEEVEILVIDGDPEGKTLRAIAREDVHKILSHRGRGRQMNEGAKIARGEILLFLHADTVLPQDALGLIDETMRDRRVAGGAFDLGFRTPRFAFKVIATVASLRSRLTRVPFGDQALFLRRDYFERIGGYKEIPLMEDVELMDRIRRLGDPIAFIGKPVLTSTRRWEKDGLLRCTLRNWLLQLLYLFGVPPERLARHYPADHALLSGSPGTPAESHPSRKPRRSPFPFLAALLLLAMALLPMQSPGQGGNRILFREDFYTLDRWRPLYFPKIAAHTLYTIERKDGESVLKAASRASASALVYRETFSVYEYSRARWRWWVGNVYGNLSPEEKSGDDYPLRVYVTFLYDPVKAGPLERLRYGLAKGLYGEYPPHSTLIYVWASHEGQAGIMDNPYTERAKMIALQRGKGKVGTWQTEEVHILEDYRRAFGADPPAAASLAVMNDSDNTGQGAVSYLDFIEVFRDGS